MSRERIFESKASPEADVARGAGAGDDLTDPSAGSLVDGRDRASVGI
jgi:hypothetical protein